MLALACIRKEGERPFRVIRRRGNNASIMIYLHVMYDDYPKSNEAEVLCETIDAQNAYTEVRISGTVEFYDRQGNRHYLNLRDCIEKMCDRNVLITGDFEIGQTSDLIAENIHLTMLDSPADSF